MSSNIGEWRIRHWIRKRWFLRKPQFRLDSSKLLPGDVLLWTDPTAKSFTIRSFTISKFSHAAIFLGDGLYAEAVGLGVRERSVETILKYRIKVIRLSESNVVDAHSIAAHAASFIFRYLSADYWTKGAMLSVLRKFPIADCQKLFCSHLVVQLYQDAGFDAFPRTDPQKVTPEMLSQLSKGKYFEDISKKVVYQTPYIPEHLANPEFETVSDWETVILQKMHRHLARWFKTHSIPVPQTWHYMLVFLIENTGPLQDEFDKEMLSEIVSSGYYQLLRRIVYEVSIPMQKQFGQINKMKNLSKKEIALNLYSLEVLFPVLESQRKEHEENLMFFEGLLQQHYLRTLDILAKYQRSLIRIDDHMIKWNVAARNALYDKLSPSDKKELWAAYRGNNL